MKFIDEAKVWIKSGDGGGGCLSFRRERFLPKGGPDGGDGGKGGNIVVVADPGMNTLLDFKYQQHFKAERGRNGSGKNMTGRSGKDREIRVPVGTVIYNTDTGELLQDLSEPGQRVVLLAGGRGGKGNAHFATATHRTPRFSQPGEPGQEMWVRLELKVLADVGVAGKPNAGKSSLVSRMSAAHPKIADYPFTTLHPQLGVVTVEEGEPFVLAEVPGLIENAHMGAGLGLRFLKHLERTRFLLHLIDLSDPEAEDPLKPYRTVRNEISQYGRGLDAKREIVVFNKLDLPEVRKRLPAAEKRYKEIGVETIAVSAATGEGIVTLKLLLARMLNEHEEV
ncbi:MAG: GTPase ObgE [Deltaproteobacteria bacterium]|nr:GTPase ObgE [Deltaproteobacteria bacterium]